ncbi:MAG: fumarate hydratase [Syntrophobacterales bacterium]|nr:fumarate hydratase [Syntrophobacterales bacterium]
MTATVAAMSAKHGEMNVERNWTEILNGPAFGEAIFDLVRRTACELPEDMETALKRAYDEEAPESTARVVLATFLENMALARKKQAPLCQDTGTPLFFINHPVGLSQRAMRRLCEKAVARATQELFLRHNAVDPVTGVNSGNNVGNGFPGVFFEECDDEAISVALILKGGGSENVGRQYSLPDDALNAGRDLEGIRRVVLDAVRRAEGKGCPPGILGICIGGDRGSAYLHSKHQLLRPLGDVNPDPALAALEELILREANTLGIGPLGLGGKATLLGVKIGALHRLPACYFVTVTYMCWENRRRAIRIEADGSCRFIG